jgi:small-conductance mechanosensitive channel
VVDIGLRSTRIRTSDNRLVIIPNNVISTDQVVNYTYPDPRYRIQVEFGVGYGQDIEMVRQLVIDTVRQVEGVLNAKPVDALIISMGENAMTMQVRWWIESYRDTRIMFDKVYTALLKALGEAGIEIPSDTYDINILNLPGAESDE